MTRSNCAAVLVTLSVIGGCGSVEPSTNASLETGAPPTTEASSVTADAPTTEPPPAPQEPETACPPVRFPTSPRTDAEIAEGSRVAERNLGAINAYVSAHSSEGGTPWLDSLNEPPRVVIGFTANVAEHRFALASLLADPDRVLVCQVAHSAAEVSVAAAEIQLTQASSDGFLSVGPGVNGVDVHLRADQQGAAERLVVRYDDLVSITLGNFLYPMPAERAPTDPNVCAANVMGPTDLNGLRAELKFDNPTVRTGQDIFTTATVTNTGDAPVTFESGSPLVGSIVQAGTATVVASFTGAIGGVGVGETLQPSESFEISVVVGTASCDPSVGYTLPPGQYDVIVPVVVQHPQIAGEPTVNLLVTSPTTLTVVP